MKMTTRFGLTPTGLLLAGLVALPGCSGTSEDVRITFCKNLTNALTDTAADVAWQEPTVQFKRPEYAATTVKFDADGEPTTATCYFEYDLAEETAMDHANPILAYSTLPYRMTLNGQDLPKPLITEITGDEQIRQGTIAMDRVKRVTENAVDKVKMTAGDAAVFAKRAAADATAYAKRTAEDATAYVKETTQQIKDKLEQ